MTDQERIQRLENQVQALKHALIQTLSINQHMRALIEQEMSGIYSTNTRENVDLQELKNALGSIQRPQE